MLEILILTPFLHVTKCVWGAYTINFTFVILKEKEIRMAVLQEQNLQDHEHPLLECICSYIHTVCDYCYGALI